ncbi:MAG: TPR repeat protein [Janthinobacterium sp.]|jgi:TPR repeat protein
MANREELAVIRRARAGNMLAQLALGKLYLFGSASLPKSAPTALHWLRRAAQQDCDEACFLIGSDIPFEAAQHYAQALLPCYERAYDRGVVQAGLVLAQLVQLVPALADDAGTGAGAGLRAKARRALEAAALAGLPEALWLLAQPDSVALVTPAQAGLPEGVEWLTRAADNGVAKAQYALLELAWNDADWDAFLSRALPLARNLSAAVAPGLYTAQDVLLMSRCAQVLTDRTRPDADQADIARFWELAAQGGDRTAQLALGLWFARMDVSGVRAKDGIASVNFKRAIRWLIQAGEQGLAEAWFVLSHIYVKPEFSQRSMAEAQAYLERAADMGHSVAQLECGINAWRTRRDSVNNDVRAAYWLLKAVAQGSAEAETVLQKVAPGSDPMPWLGQVSEQLKIEQINSQPYLLARLELAVLFNLSRAEALLLDLHAADQGHCLLVDISASYGRSKRRLALLRTAGQRQALNRIVRVFDNVDCGPNGPEGNYRQRLYRLKTWLHD